MEDNKGAVDFWYSHALISDATREGIYSLCNFSRIGPLSVLEGANVNKSKVGVPYEACNIQRELYQGA